MDPKYPVYVVSKGRWERRQTSKTLEYMNVPYHIVVEPQECDKYASVINYRKIFMLPFSNLGRGSIPARNWVWKHSISIRAKRHWILDDNIESFERYNENKKVKVDSGTVMKIAEDFADRYENVALLGFNYAIFCPASENRPPVRFNTRIYSCILIKNDIPYRWRGKYNEDTDLSLRVLKGGLCTVLFNAFLIGKRCTMAQKGGNTDELYADDGRRKMAESLMEQHPDVVKIVWKFNRWQHQVNYKPFQKNRLIKRQGIVVPKRVNNYGMVLKHIA